MTTIHSTPGEFPESERFEIISRLGAGGMGVVYKVLDKERGHHVALKTLLSFSADGLLRFKREFRSLADIVHPNLVRLGELFEAGGHWFFTMELVEGVDFLSWVRPETGDIRTVETAVDSEVTEQSDPTEVDPVIDTVPPGSPELVGGKPELDENRLRNALAQLFRGLAALHKAGKVHRDVKPSNIRVTPEGRVVVLDFGLITEATGERVSTDARVVGTAAYMAPEQAESKAVGPGADWYSVGVLLYEALTGRLPHFGAPLEMLIKKQLSEPPAPEAVAPGVPGDLNAVCVELLRTNPQAREKGRELLERIAVDWGLTKQSTCERVLSSGDDRVFVGRAEELAELDKALEDARGKTAKTVVVEGESGIGKSALVQEFISRTDLTDTVVLQGRCHERETVPYKAFDGVIDALGRYMRRLPGEAAAMLLPRRAALMARVFPVLQRVRAFATAIRPEMTQLDPQEMRSQLFGAVREMFTRLADQHHVVIAVDDLQWADHDSLALLEEVLRRPEAPSLLFICTVRTGTEGEKATSRIPGEACKIELGRLPIGEATELATLLLAKMPAQNHRFNTERIAEEADGHPLFIDELVRHLLTHRGQDTRILLDEAISSRVGDLLAEARKVLELTVVAGAPVQLQVVATAGRLEPKVLADTISRLRVEHLVRTSGSRLTDHIEPYHDRVREAISSSIDVNQRREHHQMLAETFESQETTDPEVLATHWEGAGQSERAAAYAIQAAEDAEAVLAFDHAAELYRRALELGCTRYEIYQLRTKLADALMNSGRGAEAAEVYLSAASSAAASLDPVDRDCLGLELRTQAAIQFLRTGHLDSGLPVAEEVLSAQGLPFPKTPYRALLGLLGLRIRLRQMKSAWSPRFDASPASAEELRRVDTCLRLGYPLCTTSPFRGFYLNSLASLLALKSQDPLRIARGLVIEISVAVAEGGKRNRERAELLQQLLSEIGERLGDPYVDAMIPFVRATSAFFASRFSQVFEFFEPSNQKIRGARIGLWNELANLNFVWTVSLYHLGRLNELRRRVSQFLAEAIDHGDLYAATLLRTNYANAAWLISDDLDGAKNVLEEARRHWSKLDFQWQHYWAEMSDVQVALYAGGGIPDDESPFDKWCRCYRLARRSLMHRIQFWKVASLELRARCALASGAETGIASLRREMAGRASGDAKRIAREEMQWSGPLALLLIAGSALLRGDANTARSKFEQAVAAFEAVEMSLHAAVARRRLGEILGGDEGRDLVNNANAWMRGQNIVNPDRWAYMLAPVPER